MSSEEDTEVIFSARYKVSFLRDFLFTVEHSTYYSTFFSRVLCGIVKNFVSNVVAASENGKIPDQPDEMSKKVNTRRTTVNTECKHDHFHHISLYLKLLFLSLLRISVVYSTTSWASCFIHSTLKQKLLKNFPMMKMYQKSLRYCILMKILAQDW